MESFFYTQFPPSVAIVAGAARRHRSAPPLDSAVLPVLPPVCDTEATVDIKPDTRCRDLRCNPESRSETRLELHGYFQLSSIAPWDSTRFELVRRLQEAQRNQGFVEQRSDRMHHREVAVKQMPNAWVCESHSAFVLDHPEEAEYPWLDIGCTKWLNDVEYPYACELVGVYRNSTTTFVVSELASEGDLFGWCHKITPATSGRHREQIVRPIAIQVFDAVRYLHELEVAHRDLSLENVLLSAQPKSGEHGIDEHLVKVIDFSMVTTRRWLGTSTCAKPSYQAPELHMGRQYDTFLADAFAVGVILYALVCKEYPWLSTKPGRCKLFSYVQQQGFRNYARKQRLPGLPGHVEDHLSPEVLDLLGGLLELDPNKRLTLGESIYEGRRSVLAEPWLKAPPEVGCDPVPAG